MIDIQRLNQIANPMEVALDEEVKEQFIKVFDSTWGKGGEAAYDRESKYFNTLLSNMNQQTWIDRFSLYNAFIEAAISNLSLEPGVRALAYLTTRGKKVRGANGQEVLVNNVYFTISGYGELTARIRCGQIRHADIPVVVYDNDELRIRDIDGRKSIEYTCNFPHTGHKIIACYMRITRADGSIDYQIMLEEDWTRLAGYSSKQNKGNANALYNSNNGEIDPGFLQAKCIKHAFKTYPKVRIGGIAIGANDADDDQYLLQQHMSQQYQEQSAAPEPTYQPEVTVEAGGQTMQANDDIF